MMLYEGSSERDTDNTEIRNLAMQVMRASIWASLASAVLVPIWLYASDTPASGSARLLCIVIAFGNGIWWAALLYLGVDALERLNDLHQVIKRAMQ